MNSPTTILAATVVATCTAIVFSRLIFRQHSSKIIKSPATTLLPKLTQAEKDALPYPPDALPGGRDVVTSFGSIRVYEWGPENGPKVLFVNGITTTCLTVAAIAHGMAEKGCRVMLFDLWGRGYSDSCADLPHDERLYTTQILLAISSSSLAWTSGFTLVGYSLGGGIAVAFASSFPNLVDSLALVAPVGLVREERVAAGRRIFALIALLPISILERFIKKRLQTPLFPPKDKEAALATEKREKRKTNLLPTSLKYPHVNESLATQWQIQVHAGFCTSFMSTLQHFPGTTQQQAWKLFRLRKDKILVIAATKDPIVNPEELKEDILAVLGSENLEWRLLEGAHDIPVTKPGLIVTEICDFLKSNSESIGASWHIFQ